MHTVTLSLTRTSNRVSFVLFALMLGLPLWGRAAEQPKRPDDADAAWKQIEQGMGTLQPPPGWRRTGPSAEEVADFQKTLAASARALAQQAREFLRRFPNDEHAGEARFTTVYALSHAVAAGDTDAEKEARAFVDSTLADPSLPEEDRAKVLLISGSTAFMKKMGMRFFTEDRSKVHQEMDRVMTDSLREAIKRYPKEGFAYAGLLAVADRSSPEVKGQLASEILATADAPENVKTYARHLQAGTKPFQIGKPLDIRFTALDGRAVDLAQLKGKVVLVEFWSTTCGPCIAEMPQVKAAYQKWHAEGFEIIGINLDDKETAVRRYVREKELPWPQYFDGKAWGNKFAVQYGIFGIPTLWLVDRAGNLRVTNARGGLESHIERLLKDTRAQ